MSLAVRLPPASNAAISSTINLRCPRCGEGYAPTFSEHDAGLAGQTRIVELEGQVKILTGKATAAVDKLADSEDELRRLRALLSDPKLFDSYHNSSLTAATTQQPRPSTNDKAPRSPSPSSSNITNPHPQTTIIQTQSRFSSFLSPRRTNPNFPSQYHNNNNSSHSLSTPTDLQAALSREQALRQQAEGKLTQANGELEELSAQLFQQANEMVATERKARAKLEERVEMLEKRDGEKRKRLERLEGAVQRIERVRALLER